MGPDATDSLDPDRDIPLGVERAGDSKEPIVPQDSDVVVELRPAARDEAPFDQGALRTLRRRDPRVAREDEKRLRHVGSGDDRLYAVRRSAEVVGCDERDGVAALRVGNARRARLVYLAEAD